MKVIIAVILAVLAGLVGYNEVLGYWLKGIGDIFISLLKMVVVPIAFVSIVSAILKLGGKTREVTVKAFDLMVIMSIIGVIVGLSVSYFMGIPVIEAGETTIREAKSPTIIEFVKNCIPANPFASFASGNMLQVITLAFFVGIASLKLDKSISKVFDIAQQICMVITKGVIQIAPIGVFALLYPIIAKNLTQILNSYIFMIGGLVVGSVIFTVICTIPLLKIYKVDLKFLKAIIKQDVVGAISGGASNYMAPRIENMKKNTDLKHEIIDFCTPLLSVLMRAGSCICVGIYTYFAAGAYGIELTPEKLLVVVMLSVVALMAAPGIIGGTLMDCAIVWSAVGIPLEAIALLAGIDYVMDILRTVLNIQGGEIVTACVDASEK